LDQRLDTPQEDAGEDLLKADNTGFDLNAAALLAIHTEWTSAARYGTRTTHLAGTAGGLDGSTFLTPGNSVNDDEAIDNLTGRPELDWYLYSLLEEALEDHESTENETDMAGFTLP